MKLYIRFVFLYIMQLVNQLQEELYQVIERKSALKGELRSLNFYIDVMSKEIGERTVL